MKRLPTRDLSLLSPLAPELASAIARVASDIALVIDGDGVIVSVAEGAAPLAPACAAWVGRPWADTVSADSRRKVEQMLEEVGESGIGRRREINHPDGDGGAIPVAWSAIRLRRRGAVVAVGRELRAVAAHPAALPRRNRSWSAPTGNAARRSRARASCSQVARDAMWVLDATTLAGAGGQRPRTCLLGTAGRAWSAVR